MTLPDLIERLEVDIEDAARYESISALLKIADVRDLIAAPTALKAERDDAREKLKNLEKTAMKTADEVVSEILGGEFIRTSEGPAQ